jgi:predicted transcriptional regulator
MSQFYTTIVHPIRKEFKLSCNDYCVLDTILRMQNNETHWCYMSKETMANDLDLSKQSIINIIGKLIEKELVQKSVVTKHLRVTANFYEYLNDYKKFTDGKESLPKESKKFTSSGTKSLPNNNTNNKNTFIRPLQAEIEAYCKEISFVLDANHFIDHYEARGWLIGKNPMKDWKAAVRTWKRNSNQFTPTTQQTTKISLK